jgi:hypothetical protein
MKKVEELIETSLEELLEIGSETAPPPAASDSRIIYPVKRDTNTNKRRVSEQEAKQLFLKQLENQTHFFYSVETPTLKTFRFQGLSAPALANDGRSASIDVCLYEATGTGYKRKHYVEFKAHNVKKFSISKDFFKLRYDNDGVSMINYFVHVIETFDKGTINRLRDKYQNAFKPQDSDFANAQSVKNKIIVCLCVLTLKKKYAGKPQILFMDEANYQSELDKLIINKPN